MDRMTQSADLTCGRRLLLETLAGIRPPYGKGIKRSIAQGLK